ncbi:helix-turn-helix transcriptional regulator [Paenibacillus sp. GYB003]|uniref:helix-turn-helix transcriptional regulator n=1 Tax=Paenibacillus sp. GYB003 TaxID=2994392 RepID=UPI002F96E3AA
MEPFAESAADNGSAELRLVGRSIEALNATLLGRNDSFDAEIALSDMAKTLPLIRRYFQGRIDPAGERDPSTRQTIRRLIRYVETNYDDALDLAALAKRVHLNPFNSRHYFSRMFKQKFGASPREWRDNAKRRREFAAFRTLSFSYTYDGRRTLPTLRTAVRGLFFVQPAANAIWRKHFSEGESGIARTARWSGERLRREVAPFCRAKRIGVPSYVPGLASRSQ